MDIDPRELAERIAEGEGRSLEFKRGLPRDAKVARTLCAFANTRGGLLLVGVGDNGELVGAPRPRQTMQHLRDVASERLEPPLALQAGTTPIEDKRIVWCSVPLSPTRPHAAIDDTGARSFVARVGASNRKASATTLASIRAQRTSAGTPDELQRKILAWVERQGPEGATRVTIDAFASALNVGRQRARRSFTQLELAGRLVGHGAGARKVYGLP